MLSIRDLNIVHGNIVNSEFVFVIYQQNASKWIDRCLTSVVNQKYTNWSCVIFDDASEDNTLKLIFEFAKVYPDKFLVVNNFHNYKKMRNFFYGVRYCCSNPESIIIDLDGDDWLLHNEVLNRIKVEYDNGAEQTVGSCEFFPKKSIDYKPDFNDPRGYTTGIHNWLHPRTFKKGLFDLIGIEAFTDNERWFYRATDWAYVPLLMEMSKKTVYIEDVLYAYNASGNNHFTNTQDKVRDQLKIKDFITKRLPMFPRLEQLKLKR